MAFPIKYPKLHDLEWMVEQKKTRGINDIAREVGCDPSSVSRAFSRAGIKFTPLRCVGPPGPSKAECEEAAALYRRTMNVQHVADRMGLSYGQAVLRIYRGGAKVRRGRPPGS